MLKSAFLSFPLFATLKRYSFVCRYIFLLSSIELFHYCYCKHMQECECVYVYECCVRVKVCFLNVNGRHLVLLFCASLLIIITNDQYGMVFVCRIYIMFVLCITFSTMFDNWYSCWFTLVLLSKMIDQAAPKGGSFASVLCLVVPGQKWYIFSRLCFCLSVFCKQNQFCTGKVKIWFLF